MTHQECTCLASFNEMLKEHNTEIDITFSIPRNGGPMRALPKISTSKIESRKRVGPVIAAPTFCPFCGQRYEPKVAAPAEAAEQKNTPEAKAWRRVDAEAWTVENDHATYITWSAVDCGDDVVALVATRSTDNSALDRTVAAIESMPELIAANMDLPILRQESAKLAEWLALTDWVQDAFTAGGFPDAATKHRATVMREEIERLRAAIAALQSRPAEPGDDAQMTAWKAGEAWGDTLGGEEDAAMAAAHVIEAYGNRRVAEALKVAEPAGEEPVAGEAIGLRIAERIRQEMASSRQWWREGLTPGQVQEFETELTSTCVAICEAELAAPSNPDRLVDWRGHCEWLLDLDEIHVGEGETDVLARIASIRTALSAAQDQKGGAA